ncbi:MAG: tRNA 2-thiouridine(34) synthase MnmA, partial [Candidatus Eisenbacteria bacterium]|nr:tRNA 2-thiouridine(34) synthase MnmA [Candidatus Eisenbacteria bacterium]
ALTAEQLGISHYFFPMDELFEREVVRPFAEEYARGRTPNPCVLCNERLKLGALTARALELGAEAVATGHHARVLRGTDGGPLLARSEGGFKDQSYFLYRITRETLLRLRLPLGGLRKDDVRRLATEEGLPAADRPESQDVCFLPRDGLRGFLSRRAPIAVRPGPIVDRDGRVLGEHGGIGLYTLGQRSGLGLSRPRPTYVVALDPARNAVVVGEEEDLYSRSLSAGRTHWISAEPPGRFSARAKVRSTAPAADCVVSRDGANLRVEFSKPQRAVCPGQSVVFYDGDVVLGGATIESAGAQAPS